MTGFASGQGEALGLRWTWDIRSVNGKGLDLRLRVPDWVEGLEQALRAKVSGTVKRGNVTVSLRLQSAHDGERLALNPGQLDTVLAAMHEAEARAKAVGLTLAPSSAADIVGLRGVLDAHAEPQDPSPVRKALVADFDSVLKAFCGMRQAEGKQLNAILSGQLDDIERLTDAALSVTHDRKAEQADRLRAALARIIENTDDIDEARIAQELALIAVKTDVTEEIDRLRAHINAARDLLATDGAVGRKLDFLMQEFNREANTLCSKSQSTPLTAIGLDLKTVIDQLREQVQNLE
ncbi:YicC/YloC family endoribonuclease [Pseudoprimorskyibacter insulae]|nr:YicC/YloC family endoribonuclease [Pseudoprimorskyibacter insulae]